MRKRIFFPLLALLVAALVLIPARSANAASGRVARNHHSHHAHFYLPPSIHSRMHASPFDSSQNVQYNGGSVMEGTATVYVIFWEPTNNVSATYNSLLTRYYSDIPGTGLYQNNSQYTDSNGLAPTNTSLGGTWVDTTAYPESPLLDSDIQNEVSNAQQANGWSSSMDNLFVVFTEQNEDLCFDSSQSQCASNSFCGYHNYFGSDTIYAAIPYPGMQSRCNGTASPNNDPAADFAINVASHEQMEAATDPMLNAWLDANGEEIGDKCELVYGTTNPDGSNVVWNGHPYLLQEEWDNNIGGCAITGP